MKKSIMKVAAIGMSGVMACSFAFSANGSTIMMANEQPLAGINISLDKYVENVVAEESTVADGGVADSEAEAMEAGNVDAPVTTLADTDNAEAQTSTEADQAEDQAPVVKTPEEQAEPVEAEEVKQPKETKKPEHVKTNLVYDRLGIAKVDTYLNVRKRPSEDAKVVGKMVKNAGCHIYKIKNGWAKIVSGKVNGYVKAEFMVTDEKAEKMATEVGTLMATVNTAALKIRALPSTDSTMYSVVSEEEDFDVVKENLSKKWVESFLEKNTSRKERKKVNMDAMMEDLDNWICIRVDNDKAFVAKQYVDISYKLERAVLIGDLATDGSSGVSSVRASLVQYAKQFLGNRYVYGGTSLTNGTDCSGFSMGVFRHFGYSLPRTSGSQAAATRSISGSEAKPGDLFFYSNGSRVNHVAIYIGSGMVIHASNPRTGIRISNAYYRSPVKIGRVIND